MRIRETVKRLCMVRKCCSCRRILPFEDFDRTLCRECELSLNVAKTENCPDCFKAICECTCQPSVLAKSGSLCLRKLYFYHSEGNGSAQNRLIFFMKHSRSKRAKSFVANQLAMPIRQELDGLGAENGEVLVTYCPRGRRSLVKYGFDQSAELAEAVAQLLGLDFAHTVKRRIGGKEQKLLTGTQRVKNIVGLMKPREEARGLVSGRYVILIDDIVTTGASMSACVKILRNLGAKGVICCSMASNFKKTGRI